MSAEPRFSYSTECRFKIGYATKRAARRSAKRQMTMPAELKRKLGVLEQYRCTHCGLWHNGHPVGGR